MRHILALGLMIFAAPALAQQHGGHETHGTHGSHGATAGTMPASPAAKAYEAANEKMHRDMAIKMTGDADVDFVQGMIPHHQGAVDMAKIVLQYGADPEIKKIAQEIIAAQEKEIAMFRSWLAKRQK
jgi:uncharacterized protein (DUF305 family)